MSEEGDVAIDIKPTLSAEELEKIHWFQHILTDKTNVNFDNHKVLGFIAFVVGLIFEGWVVYKTDSFDFMTYSTAVGVLLLSVSGANKIVSNTDK